MLTQIFFVFHIHSNQIQVVPIRGLDRGHKKLHRSRTRKRDSPLGVDHPLATTGSQTPSISRSKWLKGSPSQLACWRNASRRSRVFLPFPPPSSHCHPRRGPAPASSTLVWLTSHAFIGSYTARPHPGSPRISLSGRISRDLSVEQPWRACPPCAATAGLLPICLIANLLNFIAVVLPYSMFPLRHRKRILNGPSFFFREHARVL